MRIHGAVFVSLIFALSLACGPGAQPGGADEGTSTETGDGDGDAGDGDGDAGDGDGDAGDGDGDVGDGDGDVGDGDGDVGDGDGDVGDGDGDVGDGDGDVGDGDGDTGDGDSETSGGGQPDEGAYSMCLMMDDCGGEPLLCLGYPDEMGNPADGFCTFECAIDENCPASPGGTAEPSCIPAGQSNFCALDCAEGKTCPDGMECIEVQGGQASYCF